MPRNPVEKCETTFEDRYGSTTSGNLPTHKTEVCVGGAVDIGAVQAEFGDWITINDFHFYHIKCPYSNEAAKPGYDWNIPPNYMPAVTYVRDTDPSSPTYWQMLVLGPASRTDHTTTSGLMIRHSRGSKHGWLCVDPACPYYNDPLNNKRSYFYI